MAGFGFNIGVAPRGFRSRMLLGAERKLGGLEGVVHRVG